MSNKDERLYALLIYLLSFPFPIIGPLIIWLLKREESDFIDYHGKEYCNFLISYTIYLTVSGILVIVLIGIILLPLVGLLLTIFTIVAAVKSYGGEKYRIPLIFHFIK
ncbi:DUF4870 domain-containing protein [Aquibacillus sp. LR5S19]|uniref:DUF4870 domain-containing protein n=1 Tax=Aquibacillus rhizosphaerae TaxID=3051431 RepID=A0ABT7L9X4_9BACI|nr:DUF4870 domain-containing protein [Aquibacillus sp. LR5S19]MDL4842668.1 DUF4870 domain-containing protein [Aquibacillus sp. LR5S19]